MTHPAIDTAVQFLIDRGYPIPTEALQVLRGEVPLPDTDIKRLALDILAGKILAKATEALNYNVVRQTLWAAVYDAVWDYLTGDSITTTRNTLKKAVADAWVEAADIAYENGGGTLPIDEDTLDYVGADQSAQLGYVDALFQTLKALRKEGDFDEIKEAFARADGYANSLDALYNYVKASAAGNTMLTFVGDDGAESCSDCQRYKNKRHRAAWWIAHDAVPPNRNFECKGYRCDHRLVDDQGSEFTV